MQAQATVVKEEQVSRMRIGMEYAGAEELMHVGIEQRARQRGSGRGSVSGLQAGAVAAVLDQHVAAGVRLDDVRLGNAGQGIEHLGPAQHVLSLGTPVDLEAQEWAQFV